MKNLKNILMVVGAIALAVAITYGIMKVTMDNRVEYVRDNAQQRIDSITVVKQAAVISRAAIEDSLEELDEQFEEYVTETNQKINNYTTVIGQLRLEKDKLADSTKELSNKIALADLFNSGLSVTNRFRDSLVSRTNTWSDSLFATDAIAKIQDDSLFLDSKLRQLRDIRIDLVTTVSEDQSQVNTFVRSPDFDSLEVRSVTELDRKERKPWGWAVAGALIIKEAISLIFN